MKLMICGSRDANGKMLDYAKRCVERAKQRGYTIVVGDAGGVDAAVIERADELGADVEVYGAFNTMRNRSKRPGCNRVVNGNYTARDDHMIKLADVVLCIWDSKSRGTLRNAQQAKLQGKQVHLKK